MKQTQKQENIEPIRDIYFHVHLVSDSTGETLVGTSRACCAQYQHANAVEHLHALVRSEQQLEKALASIKGFPGIVLYTLVNPKRRKRLEEKCMELNIPVVSILDPALATLGRYLGAPMSSEIGAQRTMDVEYFSRIGALDFAMSHDDGQNIEGLEGADIVLIGISRTSKTPTCIYLANRGFKTGNFPLVVGAQIPQQILSLKSPLVIGLTSSPDRIVQIRRNRITSLGEKPNTQYIDKQMVRAEMTAAKRLFNKNAWPIIDVTRRSIEETAARIINLYQERTGL